MDPLRRNKLAQIPDSLLLLIPRHMFVAKQDLLMTFTFKIPRSYKLAMKSPDSIKWKEACNTEFNAIMSNWTWKLVPRKPGMTIIHHKWVFDIKTSESRSVERYKAHLVARGDSQTKGVNFKEVYAPVVRFISFRVILHITAILD